MIRNKVLKTARAMVKTNQDATGEQCLRNDSVLEVSRKIRKKLGKVIMRSS